MTSELSLGAVRGTPSSQLPTISTALIPQPAEAALYLMGNCKVQEAGVMQKLG